MGTDGMSHTGGKKEGAAERVDRNYKDITTDVVGTGLGSAMVKWATNPQNLKGPGPQYAAKHELKAEECKFELTRYKFGKGHSFQITMKFPLEQETAAGGTHALIAWGIGNTNESSVFVPADSRGGESFYGTREAVVYTDEHKNLMSKLVSEMDV